MKYEILEGIATADIAYKIYGKTIPELFSNAAEAVEQTMVDVAKVAPWQISSASWRIKSQNSKLENLLLDFLNELVFLKDSKRLVFSKFFLKIKQNKIKEQFSLQADCWGEKIDASKHKLHCDVKAVTQHKLEIKKEDKLYTTIIVLDI